MLKNTSPSLLSLRVRETIRRDPISWAASSGINLRPYQRCVAYAIKDSVIHHLGLTFVVIFPRQSGKNELQAHIFSWLLFRYAAKGGGIVSVSPTYIPQTANNMRRVRLSLDACIGSRGRWKSCTGLVYQLGKACLQFYSGSPQSKVVGATADLLLSVDEAQEISTAKFDKDFDPMSASDNSTRVFWGTAWTANTLLERQRRYALRAQELDGIQRVFFFTSDDVRRFVPAYGVYVDRVIAEQGRNHPLVRTQYFCETIDAQSGMFTPARIALIFPSRSGFEPLSAAPAPRGAGASNQAPSPFAVRANGEGGVGFLIDVAGMDESKTSLASSLASEGLGSPGRDSTTLTIVGLDLSTLAELNHPTYGVLARHSWTGQNHLAVFGQIKNLAQQWSPQHIVIDATGVGEGLWALLDRAFPTRVIPVKFTSQEKSEIGWQFLSIIESGRFHDSNPTSDLLSRSVRLQYSHCISEILPGPSKTLRWGVPDGTRGPDGELIHDDYILADALTAILDRKEWHIHTAPFFSEGFDPLDRFNLTDFSNPSYVNRF